MADNDPNRTSGNPFDQPTGYSGQDYHRDREAAARLTPAADAPPERTRDIPPDAGRRAVADPTTGEVHGSGAGAGGGNPGEDFDSATPSGDSYPLTGGEGSDHTARDLGVRSGE